MNQDRLKIAYIAAGAGGMYCGSCLHDNALAAAILRQGHDIALIPTYTPLRTDEPNVSLDRVFYNGISVYLQQKFAWARNGFPGLERLLDHPRMLSYLAKVSASTNARDLGELTVSMLRGEQGHQRRELEKLVCWLQKEYRPHIVTITNSMLAGMAKSLKKALGVPVLCAIQGEDIFLEDLAEPYRGQARALLREKAQDVDGFIATSEYYRQFMHQYLQVPLEKIHTVPPGINLRGHGEATRAGPPRPFVIGYLARICPEKGLHLLVDAVAELAGQVGKENIRLRVAGYLGARDRAYWKKVRRQVKSAGLERIWDYVGEVDRAGKIAFLNRLHVLSVPTPYREPKGLFLLEALANGVPVVQPNHGAFPEWIAATGGGILVEPHSPAALAAGLAELMHDESQRSRLGLKGKNAVHQHFSDDAMARATLAVYRQYVARTVLP